MASFTYHRKKDGTTYVYRQESYWDKEKKAPRTRQVCVGKLADDGETVVYNKRFASEAAREALEHGQTVTESVTTGQTLLMGAALGRSGLEKVLRSSFPPQTADRLVSLAMSIVALDGKMYHAGYWMEDNDCPCHDDPMTSQEISRFLGGIARRQVEDFLSSWMAYRRQGMAEQYCYDITSISSANADNPFVEWGYNRDKEKMAQINISLLSGARSHVPTFYEVLPGSLSDVRTIGELTAHLKKLGAGRLRFLLDRGFYSQSNLKALRDGHHGFYIPLPSSTGKGRELIDACRDDIENPEHLITTAPGAKEALWGMTVLDKLEDRRMWYHVFLDAGVRTDSILSFFGRLSTWENELVTGNTLEANEGYYEKYFIVKATPKRGRSVKRNQEAIDAYKKNYTGYWVLLSSCEKDAREALAAYRERASVENLFDDMKNELDMDRTRTHNERTMEGRVFVQFLALIILSQIRTTLAQKSESLSRNYSVSEVMLRLGSYRRTRFSGRYGEVTSTATKAQRELFKAFGIEVA